MKPFRKLLARAREHWLAWPLEERRRALIVMATVPLAALLATAASDRPAVDMVVILRGLQSGEQKSCTEYLELQQIPFEVSDNGRVLKVPAEHSAELKIELIRLIERKRSATVINTAPKR